MIYPAPADTHKNFYRADFLILTTDNILPNSNNSLFLKENFQATQINLNKFRSREQSKSLPINKDNLNFKNLSKPKIT